jgi:hypothetical protein
LFCLLLFWFTVRRCWLPKKSDMYYFNVCIEL